MRVKKQTYLGVPAIALHMNDATTKVVNKLLRMQEHEKEQARIQAESFTSTVSHEMRTPIETMLFMMNMLISFFQQPSLEVGNVPKCIDYCTMIMSQLEFLLSFVEDLLNLQQMRDGVFLLASEPLVVAKIIQGVVNIFTPQARAQKVELTYQKEDCSLLSNQEIPPLLGDPRRLKQILMNLIKNAMKFTQKGHIQVFANYKEEPESTLTI